VKYAMTATITVKIPSKMKIHLPKSATSFKLQEQTHLHPAKPPTPSICAIPYANNPENAPATLAALKNSACRNCASCLAYHIVI
jgi:hypothetical protein